MLIFLQQAWLKGRECSEVDETLDQLHHMKFCGLFHPHAHKRTLKVERSFQRAFKKVEFYIQLDLYRSNFFILWLRVWNLNKNLNQQVKRNGLYGIFKFSKDVFITRKKSKIVSIFWEVGRRRGFPFLSTTELTFLSRTIILQGWVSDVGCVMLDECQMSPFFFTMG